MSKKVTVIGGGTGTFVVLSGLKKFELDLAAIVTMMDSGGSTGKLRAQLGVLPPGDLRQSMVALSEAPDLWRRLFLYRFTAGDLEGHNFGNIFISALEKVCKNYDEVIETASFVLKTKGQVIPVTFDKAHLCVEYENGKIIKGEGNIDEDNLMSLRIKKAFLEPEAAPNPKAIQRIVESDYIVIGPGDLYTSIIPILLTQQIKDSIKNSKAIIIYNVNLMSKAGQTLNYKVSDHLKDIELYLGKQPEIVIVNNGAISKDIISWYQSKNEEPVVDDLNSTNFRGKIVREDIIDREIILKPKSDKLTRSILRHDINKLSQLLIQQMI